jgi:hypothetical protein
MVRASHTETVVGSSIDHEWNQVTQPLQIIIQSPQTGGIEHQCPDLVIFKNAMDDIDWFLFRKGADFLAKRTGMEFYDLFEGWLGHHIGRGCKKGISIAFEAFIGLSIGISIFFRKLCK